MSALEDLPGPAGRRDTAGAGDRATLLKVLAGFWLAFLLLYALRTMAISESGQLISFPRRLLVSCIGAGLSWLMLLVLERANPRSTLARAIWVVGLSGVMGCAFTLTNAWGFYLLSPFTGERCVNGAVCTPAYLWQVAKEYVVNFTFVFAAWGLLCLWMKSAAEAREANDRVAAANDAARTAEIRALRYQVNPHFLFNCLNSLATLVNRRDPTEAQAMIDELGEFLRYGLANDPTADVELADEIDMQLRYLALERRRFAHRMSVHVNVADDVSRVRIPSLILQPLVENAIKHGVANTSAPVRLVIAAARTGSDELRLTVSDDAWTDRTNDKEERVGFGIGLRNVSDRLIARYGARASVKAEPGPDGGFEVTLTLPSS